MPPDEDFSDVQKKLEKLLSDNDLVRFHPFLSKLQEYSKALNPPPPLSSPATYNIIIEMMIPSMQKAIEQGNSISDTLKSVEKEPIIQQYGDVHPYHLTTPLAHVKPPPNATKMITLSRRMRPCLCASSRAIGIEALDVFP